MARRISFVLSDARNRSLAHRRHPAAALARKGRPHFEDVVPSVRKYVGELSFQACSWYSTYRIHHRCAARFRDRRCFLLGDAAHIHSPVGAQGMNTGLQDAYNLAWKLALVVSGRAEAALLDSYEDERVPVAQRLLSTTDRAFSLIVSDTWLAGLLRTRVLARVAAFAMRFDRVRTLAFLTISRTGMNIATVCYRKHSGSASCRPRAGDRFPWLRLSLQPNGAAEDMFKSSTTRDSIDRDRHHSLRPECRTSGPLAHSHRSTRFHNDRELARVKIPQPSFYLLRPDGHVGLAGRTRYRSGVALLIRAAEPCDMRTLRVRPGRIGHS